MKRIAILAALFSAALTFGVTPAQAADTATDKACRVTWDTAPADLPTECLPVIRAAWDALEANRVATDNTLAKVSAQLGDVQVTLDRKTAQVQRLRARVQLRNAVIANLRAQLRG